MRHEPLTPITDDDFKGEDSICSDEDFEYDSDEYMEFVFAEEKFYDFVYYTLDKRYGVKNCLPY